MVRSSDKKRYDSISDQAIRLREVGEEADGFPAESAPETPYLKMKVVYASPGDVSRVVTQG